MAEKFDLNSARLLYWQETLICLTESIRGERAELIEKLSDNLLRLQQIEWMWAFPGGEVMCCLASYFAGRRYALMQTVIENIIEQLQVGEFRYNINPAGVSNKDLLSQLDVSSFSAKIRKDAKPICKYFEVLVVGGSVEVRQRIIDESISCKNNSDDFIYGFVFADSVAKAIRILTNNYDVLASICIGKTHALDCAENALELDRFLGQGWADRVLDGVSDCVPKAIYTLFSALRPQLIQFLMTDEVHPKSVHAKGFDRTVSISQPFYDLHYSLLSGIRNLFSTPFFDALRDYSKKPKAVFHALPISCSASIKNSNWLSDFHDFYGSQLFSAESSSTQGGLDSLLDPKGPIKQAGDKAAKAFGALDTYFVTNGTSTANKIVIQANINPGDIVLVAADCHKSVPYGLMMSAANVIFLETYPLEQYDLFGAVRLAQIKEVLLQLRMHNQLQNVKQISLTNCTFDGVLYNAERFMMEILALAPQIIFHWDEAWFAHGYFHENYFGCSAMRAARSIEQRLNSEQYKSEFEFERNRHRDGDDLDCARLPTPGTVVRVYATQSTHKSLTAFRQGSMIHVYDRKLNRGRFLEAFRMHTSTSPNYQIIASLDVARRQVALEGYRLTDQTIHLANRLRHEVSRSELLRRFFRVLNGCDILPEDMKSDVGDNPHLDLVEEFSSDPTRVLLDVSRTGMDGVLFRELLMTRYDVQVNKTSNKTVLFIVNIGATAKLINYLVTVLNDIASRISRPATPNLIDSPAVLPLKQREYAPKYVNFSSSNYQSLDLRQAYYDSFDEDATEYRLLDRQLIDLLRSGEAIYCAVFITPYPPGFPLLVPGQKISQEVAGYLMGLQVKEIHGYVPNLGLKVFLPRLQLAHTVIRLNRESEVLCEVN